MENIQEKFREIDLLDFTSFFVFLPGLFKIFWPTVEHKVVTCF